MTTADPTALLGLVRAAVPDLAVEAGPSVDQPTIYVPRERLLDTCRALAGRDLAFALLADVTAVDWWPREPRFEVVYHLVSIERTLRLRLKTRVPGEDPHVETVQAIWPAAGWLEREVWDLFGIVFDGHPDLRRLLMPDDWEGYPLRKDYPVQIRAAVKTSTPLQITEEEFRASVEADRQAREPR